MKLTCVFSDNLKTKLWKKQIDFATNETIM
jgi:hypothetical protein